MAAAALLLLASSSFPRLAPLHAHPLARTAARPPRLTPPAMAAKAASAPEARAFSRALSQEEVAALSQQVRTLRAWDAAREALSARLGRRSSDEEVAAALRLSGGAVEYARQRGEMLAAKSTLIRANLGLVVFVAKKFVDQGLPLQDLIQEGAIGLMLAAERFDESLGYRFSTYATWWIRQSIMRALIRSKAIRLPDRVHYAVKRLRHASRELEQQLGRAPTQEECAAHLSLPVERVREIEMAQALTNTLSIDEPLQREGRSERTVIDRLSLMSAAEESPTEAEDEEQLTQAMSQLLQSSLTEREAQVLRLRYGLGRDGESSNSVQVARELGISPARVREVEASAIKKLRARAVGLRSELP